VQIQDKLPPVVGMRENRILFICYYYLSLLLTREYYYYEYSSFLLDLKKEEARFDIKSHHYAFNVDPFTELWGEAGYKIQQEEMPLIVGSRHFFAVQQQPSLDACVAFYFGSQEYLGTGRAM
jgi:hypothetical protein